MDKKTTKLTSYENFKKEYLKFLDNTDKYKKTKEKLKLVLNKEDAEYAFNEIFNFGNKLKNDVESSVIMYVFTEIVLCNNIVYTHMSNKNIAHLCILYSLLGFKFYMDTMYTFLSEDDFNEIICVIDDNKELFCKSEYTYNNNYRNRIIIYILDCLRIKISNKTINLLVDIDYKYFRGYKWYILNELYEHKRTYYKNMQLLPHKLPKLVYYGKVLDYDVYKFRIHINHKKQLIYTIRCILNNEGKDKLYFTYNSETNKQKIYDDYII